MRNLCILALLATLPLLVTSCATTQKSPVAFEQLAAANIPHSTFLRMQAGRVLSYEDILALSKAGVADATIVQYLKSTKAPYRLTNAQLLQLSDSGAGSSLVNYLGRSVGYYQASQASQTGSPTWDDHPYFNDYDYMGPAPFDYFFPSEWY